MTKHQWIFFKTYKKSEKNYKVLTQTIFIIPGWQKDILNTDIKSEKKTLNRQTSSLKIVWRNVSFNDRCNFWVRNSDKKSAHVMSFISDNLSADESALYNFYLNFSKWRIVSFFLTISVFKIDTTTVCCNQFRPSYLLFVERECVFLRKLLGSYITVIFSHIWTTCVSYGPQLQILVWGYCVFCRIRP
jgi:hypothetical protein